MAENERIRSLDEADFKRLIALFESVTTEGCWLRSGRSAGLVAASGDEVVGYVSIYPDEEYGQVLGMLVDQRYRRRGIGKTLVAQAIAWARSWRIPALSLRLFAHNKAAVAPYR